MSSKDILEQAIQKAIDGGWDFSQLWAAISPDWEWEIWDGDEAIKLTAPDKSIFQGANPYWSIDWLRLIFNHDFAKALWGEEWPKDKHLGAKKYLSSLPYWKYHIAELAISEEPIKYLGEHLDD